jgi:hypothetical protein
MGLQNTSNIKNITSGKNTADALSLFDAPKTTPVLSLTKKDKSLGNIYLPYSFSSSQESTVLEIKRENKAYKAVVPFLFDSPGFNSHLALSTTNHTSVTAGLEFRIPLGMNK